MLSAHILWFQNSHQCRTTRHHCCHGDDAPLVAAAARGLRSDVARDSVNAVLCVLQQFLDLFHKKIKFSTLRI
jgi:hypothetical protein